VRDAENRARAVQVDPIKPKLKPPGITRLKLIYDVPVSNFAFKFNLRHYKRARAAELRANQPPFDPAHAEIQR
jgi:hypothetical protein